MTEVRSVVNRGQFIRNAAKGSVLLVGTGGVLATMDGVAFAKGATRSDITILQTGFIAETLAVKVYSTILTDFSTFKGLKNKDYFQRALRNEQDHQAAWKQALGSKHTPTGFTLAIPSAATRSTKALLGTGVALETAFVETYLGAVRAFSSLELKMAAAEVASNEATHFSFFDAAYGGHAVLPSFPGNITAARAAATLKQDGFLK